MRLAAYVQLWRMRPPFTGVSRHAVSMLRGLAAGGSVTVIGAAPDLDRDGRIPPDSGLAGFPVIRLPLAGQKLEKIWHFCNFPKAETWAPGFDWIYTPTECFIPTRRSKLAVTVHDLMPLETDLPWSATPGHQRMQRRWQLKFRPIVKRARLFLAVSDFTKQRLVNLLGIEPDRIAVVGNGVDEMFFAPPPAETERGRSLRGGNPTVLITGGLTAKKGGAAVLAVAEELLRRESPLRFIVVGFHNDEHLLQRSRSLPNVVHAGHVNDDEYHSLLGHSACLLFLSRYEGFGIPIMEAMAMGTPVVASTFASIPEVVGDAGYLVDAGRSEEIADLLQEIADNPAGAAALVARGRERAARCRWSNCVERLERAFAEHS